MPELPEVETIKRQLSKKNWKNDKRRRDSKAKTNLL